MKVVKGSLSEKIKRTPSIESFRFILEEKIDFIPGQFLQVIFSQEKDNKELNKYLSFSSSPAKEYIEVTKRLSQSAFSKKLINLKIGDKVLFKAPMGNCIFKEEYKKIGFLIGGIGITPVISIIEDVVEKSLDTDIVLFYSNRIEEEIAFKDRLDRWQQTNSNLKIFYTITEHLSKDKKYISGRIDKKLLLEKVNDWQRRVLFIYGPPKMVEAMESLSVAIGCQKENIRTESFIGY